MDDDDDVEFFGRINRDIRSMIGDAEVEEEFESFDRNLRWVRTQAAAARRGHEHARKFNWMKQGGKR